MFGLPGGKVGYFFGDPFWQQVRLLAHFDGANGATTFTDTSGYTTLTANGGGALTTAQQKFGTASLACDGGTDGVELTPTSNFAFGTGDFTIEAFIRPTSYPNGGHTVFDARQGSVVNGTWPVLYVSNTGVLIFSYGNGTGVMAGVSGGSISLNAWTHVAYSRKAGTGRLFVGGVQVASAADATNAAAFIALIGRSEWPGGDFAGQIDEVRVTLAGRYVSAFTPPTAPFLIQ